MCANKWETMGTNLSKMSITSVVLAVLIITSCKKDQVPVEGNENNDFLAENCIYGGDFTPISNPNFSESGIIPMHMNNYWKYADSTWDSGGNLIESDVHLLQSSEARMKNGDVWWTLNYPVGIVHQSNDTLFNYEYLWPSGCPGKTPNYFLFDADSITSTFVMEGDMAFVMSSHKLSSIATPAGTFLDCLYYNKSGLSIAIIKPGIGIIEFEGSEPFTNNSRKLTLIEYYLE